MLFSQRPLRYPQDQLQLGKFGLFALPVACVCSRPLPYDSPLHSASFLLLLSSSPLLFSCVLLLFCGSLLLSFSFPLPLSLPPHLRYEKILPSSTFHFL